MIVRIYQVNLERDKNRVAFEPYDYLAEYQGSDKVDSEIYDKVFDGSVEAEDLEDIYGIFNKSNKPQGFKGRSLSVSDVIEIVEPEDADEEPGFYFCDDFGYVDITDDFYLHEGLEMHEGLESPKITVVVCEPGRQSYVADIDTDLKSLQNIVGGHFEIFCPFDEPVCIVCNEEGKFNGNRPCRNVYDENGNILDTIYGTFFICDCSGEDFDSMTKEQQRRYLEMF